MKIWELFSGLDRAFGTYLVTEKGGKKLSGQAKTLQQPLNQDIWDLHLSGERSLGVIPIKDDSTVSFAAIDIDVYPLDHALLEARVNELKLPLVVVRSKSGGAHLYLFVKAPGTTAEFARQKMAEWAAELGYAGVEIFPKQDELRDKEDVGNWINMPYHGGDKDELRYAIINAKRASLKEFELYATGKQVDHDTLKAIDVDGPDSDLLEDGPPCLQTLFRTGFPEGSRNISLFNLGVLAKKKWPDEWQDKIDEMNEQLIDPPLGPGEVAQIKRNLDKKTYFFKCNDSPINAVCQKHICINRKYGIGDEAVTDFEDFKIEGATRILTEEIYYIVTINGKRIHLDANAMCSQQAFKLTIMKQTGQPIPPMKPRHFNLLINKIAKDAQIVEAPKHSGRRGVILEEVIQFCSMSIAEDWEQCMSGLPLPDDKGGFYFNPHAVVKLIKKRLQLRDLKPQEMFEALSGEGIEISEKRVGGRTFWYMRNIESRPVIKQEVM